MLLLVQIQIDFFREHLRKIHRNYSRHIKYSFVQVFTIVTLRDFKSVNSCTEAENGNAGEYLCKILYHIVYYIYNGPYISGSQVIYFNI